MFEAFKRMIYAYATLLLKNVRGEIGIGKIVGLAVGLIVAAAIIPEAVVDITNTTLWTGAPTAVLTLVPVIGIIVVVALMLMVLGRD